MAKPKKGSILGRFKNALSRSGSAKDLDYDPADKENQPQNAPIPKQPNSFAAAKPPVQDHSNEYAPIKLSDAQREYLAEIPAEDLQHFNFNQEQTSSVESTPLSESAPPSAADNPSIQDVGRRKTSTLSDSQLGSISGARYFNQHSTESDMDIQESTSEGSYVGIDELVENNQTNYITPNQALEGQENIYDYTQDRLPPENSPYDRIVTPADEEEVNYVGIDSLQPAEEIYMDLDELAAQNEPYDELIKNPQESQEGIYANVFADHPDAENLGTSVDENNAIPRLGKRADSEEPTYASITPLASEEPRHHIGTSRRHNRGKVGNKNKDINDNEHNASLFTTKALEAAEEPKHRGWYRNGRKHLHIEGQPSRKEQKQDARVQANELSILVEGLNKEPQPREHRHKHRRNHHSAETSAPDATPEISSEKDSGFMR